ncbi:CpaE family protein [Ferrimonas balearica]|uniref:AAA family ATPase n=1 Tax=Ferrimonas balearica TaxID=44012 RepID=UPI001C99100B|nr:AAA family ATPase [Ferrimonas balearica]MBY5992032.1 AAA family ATPase [Ferrimonas balearica]
MLLTTLLVTPDRDAGLMLSEQLLTLPNLQLTRVSQDEMEPHHLQANRLLILLLPEDLEAAQLLIDAYTNRCEHLLVVAPVMTPDLMRSAMKAGAVDFIPLSDSMEDLGKALFGVAEQLAQKMRLAPSIVVLNSKGGCGTSFLSAAIADQLANRDAGKPVALVDGDQVQAGQTHLLNVEPDYFFHHALAQAEELDDTALEGMMSQLENLHLLPAAPFSQQDSKTVDYLQLPQLMFKLRSRYGAVVVDLSRGAESWANPFMMEADALLLVIQDSLASLRSATATVRHLVFELGVEKSRIHLVFNRYCARKGVVSLSDAKEMSGLNSVYTVRNDFRCVNTCLDEGKRLSLFAAKEPVTKDIANLCNSLLPQDQKSGDGFWARLWR